MYHAVQFAHDVCFGFAGIVEYFDRVHIGKQIDDGPVLSITCFTDRVQIATAKHVTTVLMNNVIALTAEVK